MTDATESSPEDEDYIFPVELFRLIIENSWVHGNATLVALISTCKLFRDIGEPVLYEAINTRALWPPPQERLKTIGKYGIGNPTLWFNHYRPKIVKLLTTFRDHPRLAALVKALELDLKLWGSRDVGLGIFPEDPEFAPLVTDALANVVNARIVIIHVPSMMARVCHILERCGTTSLEFFEWGGQDDSNEEGGGYLVPFIAKQRALRHLGLFARSYEGFGGVDETGLVNAFLNVAADITSFSGGFLPILSILPRRNVTTLTWKDGTDAMMSLNSLDQQISSIVPALEIVVALKWERHNNMHGPEWRHFETIAGGGYLHQAYPAESGG